MAPYKFVAYGSEVALGMVAGAGSAAVGALGGSEFNSLIFAAACAGSATAIAFNAFNSAEKEVGTIVRRVTRSFVFFLIGVSFGLFMGASIAGFLPAVDRIGGTYLGGLMGYGLVAVLLSGSMREGIGEAILAVLRLIIKDKPDDDS